jgi:hypothetical protein
VSASAIADAVMRATGILALSGIAVIHLVQLVPTFQATPLLGAAFVVLIAGTLVVGARLISARLSAAQLWVPVAALGVAAIGGYVFTRVLSTPLDNQDVGNWACMLGIAALFVEGMLVALSAYAMSIVRRQRSETGVAQIQSAVAEPASNLVRVHASGSGR